MKNFTSLIASCGLILGLNSGLYANQTKQENGIAKKLVVAEKWGGTWCGPCQGAAKGFSEMFAENLNLALISFQMEKAAAMKEKYQIPEATERVNYYVDKLGTEISYPTSIFDGMEVHKGGNAYGSIYEKLKPLYDKRAGLLTAFDVEAVSASLEKLSFNVKIKVSKVAEYENPDNLYLRVALVEKHVEQNWQDMTYLHYVARDMYPSAQGTKITFNADNTFEVEVGGNLKQDWFDQELELVFYVQDDDTKEILQADKVALYRTMVHARGSKTKNCNDIEYYWEEVSPFTDELSGYKIYNEDKYLGEVGKGENVFVWKNAPFGYQEVEVSAVYKGGETETGETIEGKAYKTHLAPTPKALKLDNLNLAWGKPDSVIDSRILLRRHQPVEKVDGEWDVVSEGSFLMEKTWICYKITEDEVKDYAGLDISEISFMAGNSDVGYAVGIFEDGELIYSQNVPEDEIEANEWNTVPLSTPYFISGEYELLVGYWINKAATKPIKIDNGPVLYPGKSNLIGIESATGSGIEWEQKYEGNNLIQIGFGIPSAQGSLPAIGKFLGYNVYMNYAKMTDAPIAERNYAVNTTNAIYHVTSVYENVESYPSNQVGDRVANEELISAADQGIVVYPNPTKDYLTVEADVEKVEGFNITGQKVLEARDRNISLVHLKKGVYFLKIHVVKADGSRETYVRKIVKQ